MNNKARYDNLFEAYKKAYQAKSKQQNQQECNKYWNSIKDTENFISSWKSKISELNKIQVKGNILSFFSKNVQKDGSSSSASTSQSSSSSSQASSSCASSSIDLTLSETTSVLSREVATSQTMCPKQIELNQKILIVKSDINGLLLREKVDLLPHDDQVRLKKLQNDVTKLEKEIKNVQQNQKRQKEFRAERKRKNEELLAENPEIASKLMIRSAKGRPSIVEQQPELLSTIIKIATLGSAADDKRRSESLRTVKTLDELTEALKNAGFDIARSTVYYHLQARNLRTIDGKKHVKTVPVRLIKAAKDQHKSHPDSLFCAATLNNLLGLASFLGPTEVAIISQDDKAKVPLGLPAANCQVPLLMNMEYRVSLPDHDWVIANRHKLIPSVYAALCIDTNGFGDKNAVKYSGPTYIAIRSGKHSSSTAYSHCKDFERLFEIDSFNDILLTSDGLTKPVMIMLVDGGPDENPRYQKTIQVAIHHFIERSLDAIFISTNAPHRSAFNPVERRMAPLSKQMAGLILPHDHYGTHLDASGKTIDEDLEYKNFKFAGEALSEVFSNVVIDSYQTTAEFIDREESEIKPNDLINKSESWISNHVRSTQYMTEIVKCGDVSCCLPFRGKYHDVIKSRFLPAPIPLSYSQQIEIGKQGGDKIKFTSLFQSLYLSPKDIPYDSHCPSLVEKLQSRCCRKCNIYFASLTHLQNHRKIHKNEERESLIKIRPKRIIKKRNNEYMAIFEQSTGLETCEWIESENMQCEIFSLPEEPIKFIIPIICLESRVVCPWELEP